MKKVFLTGGTGLIGKYAIQPLLDVGFEVFAASSKNQLPKAGVTWVKTDLLNLESIKKTFDEIKPEYLLHFAWDTTPGKYLESDSNYIWGQNSFKMLEYFKNNGGKRAVFAGTCFEYEFMDEPLKENGKLNPTSTYAKCKNELNQKATLWAKENDLSFGWGRIFYVYGEGENEKRLVPFVINSLKNDKKINITAGKLVKDYLFAGDIAESFVAFLNSDVTGCVNICSAKPVKIKEIVSLIAKKLNKEHLVSFEDKLSNEPRIILGDNTRLVKEVGYTPRYSMNFVLDNILLK